MPFNIALSGLRASSTDLEVTGNNIANASTVGFKQSRTEFGDIYSNSFLGNTGNSAGGGVTVQNIRQLFDGGNISGTQRGLDLAIDGNGFYVLSDGGETKYSRAGQFGVDKDGFVVNNTGMNLQGFEADAEGNVGGILTDIQVDNSSLSPRRTTLVNPTLNLDSSELVLEERGTQLAAGDAGTAAGLISPQILNNYPSVDWNIVYGDGTSAGITTPAGASAGAVAASLSSLSGVDASASTDATIPQSTFNMADGDVLSVNGVPFTIDGVANPTNEDKLSQLALDINSSALGGITAVLTGTPGGTGANELTLDIIHNQGGDLQFQYSGAGTAQIDSNANPNYASSLVMDGTVPATTQAVVAGVLTVVRQEGTTFSAVDTGTAIANTDIIESFSGQPFSNNVFDPLDSGTYNHATSTSVYDSLGNSHVQTLYFVKQTSGTSAQPNTWQMHVQIDGEDVGDPVIGTQPTRASYTLVFNDDGSLNSNLSDQVLISNWVPLDADGNSNGAAGPINVVDGGTLPVPDPATSSNFEINIDDTTQYGSPFSINDMQQNGFTTGRLAGLDVDESGILFARYTNGESRVLSQVALANFNNEEGLSPTGDTAWVQTFASGNPIVGAPGTGSLGSISSSSLEESNVDLSDQLVNLIIAQRNYQANAKTIETADQVTQTILNI